MHSNKNTNICLLGWFCDAWQFHLEIKLKSARLDDFRQESIALIVEE